MLGSPTVTWQEKRREVTRTAILDAAWEVARADGIANLTLRAVAERVGMRPPSLYSHFASKDAIHDAMFGQAWAAYDETVVALEIPDEPREALRALSRNFVDFALADLPRYLLMDQRVIPDFRPSEGNYAPAVRVYGRITEIFRRITGGVRDEDLDLLIIMLSGLVGNQWSNDPGGTRYVRQLDRVVDLLADELGLPSTHHSHEDARR